jgi:hypothetical protein
VLNHPSAIGQITDAWLREQERVRGRLQCNICGYAGLRIYHWSENLGDDAATVDHSACRSCWDQLDRPALLIGV